MAELVAPVCPDDGATARLVDSSTVYGRSFGRIWKCPTAGCRRYVGAHPNGQPKGTLANDAIRKARQAAHAAFDGWWKRAGLKRGRAYRELADRLGIAVAHIGEMDEAECARVVAMFGSP